MWRKWILSIIFFTVRQTKAVNLLLAAIIFVSLKKTIEKATAWLKQNQWFCFFLIFNCFFFFFVFFLMFTRLNSVRCKAKRKKVGVIGTVSLTLLLLSSTWVDSEMGTLTKARLLTSVVYWKYTTMWKKMFLFFFFFYISPWALSKYFILISLLSLTAFSPLVFFSSLPSRLTT